MSFTDQPHRRLNILTNEWILCSPHRSKRPWQGQIEKLEIEERPTYDEKCYLCPGNERVNGTKNPKYEKTYAFVNDFSALLSEFVEDSKQVNEEDLIVAQPERGICKVVIFSPDHSKSIPTMNQKEIRNVIDCWTEEFEKLSKEKYINYVQIFENKGEMMGCSNPHPHSQIWSTEEIPQVISQEIQSFKNWKDKKDSCLLCSYLKLETEKKIRIISKNSNFICLVPYWAVWPFETMIIPLDHVSDLSSFTSEQRDDLASIMKEITTRYDNLFQCSFPYSMGIHQRPISDDSNSFHLHFHFFPPLLRSSTVRKFFVGYELLCEAQRDITAEKAAELISKTSSTHYSQK
jgi:UDPglucose--hexose-1-phosphate uridylyltransferase